MNDLDLLSQNGRVVLVVLQDGRQVEGELHSMSGRYEIGGETFDAWEIEELEDVTWQCPGGLTAQQVDSTSRR